MKILDENMMKELSFPDFEVEKIVFLPEKKALMIFVEGAWLNINAGHQLGRGILHFNDWEDLSISSFDYSIDKWLKINELTFEPLKDICELKFSNSTICLYGFGKQIGHWMEWKIYKSKMYAEFNVET